MRNIRYRPKNIRETLVELKDSSELAVDLAYSAVLFDSDELASEVIELTKEVDYLRYHARIAMMLAAKSTADAESLVGIFQVVDGAVSITDAAADIAQIQLRGFGIPAAFRSLPDAHERFVRVTVSEAASLAGHQIGELGLETEKGISIIAVRRDENWEFDPVQNDSLLGGDVVFARGPVEGVAEFYEQATTEVYEPPDIAPVDDAVGQAIQDVVTLKNVSELAIGLSYSAALYDSDAFAEEVKDLEAQSDSLRQDLENWVVSEDVPPETSPGELRGLFHLAIAAEVISDAALDIAEVVFRDVELHPVFGHAIRQSKEVITSITVAEGSGLVGRTITEIEHEVEGGMIVLALHREAEWTFDPPEGRTIETGDTLVLKGPRRGVPLLRRLAGSE